MPVNWSGSRPNLDRLDTVTSLDSPDTPASLASPHRFPSLVSISSHKSGSNENIARRRIVVNQSLKPPYVDKHSRPTQKFHSNSIRTSKYTLLTFLPKNLYEQFRGIANFYFLMMVILQIFSYFATVSIFIAAAPILFIVVVTGIKDAIEDLRRHSSDNYVNTSFTYVLHEWINQNYKGTNSSQLRFQKHWVFTWLETIQNKLWKKKDYERLEKFPINLQVKESNPNLSNVPLWTRCEWRNVKVGDFIYLRNNDPVPADMIIISTSEPENICLVETKNLDGETNLKVKKGIQEFSEIRTPYQCSRLKLVIDSELPNPNLYSYNAVVIMKPHNKPQQVVPISANGIMLRGCHVRNTKWVIGIAVYTGLDTKIMLNSGATPTKRSRIDRLINPQVMLNFVILFGMCLISGLAAAVYQIAFIKENSPTVLLNSTESESPEIAAILSFFRCMIIFQNIIPIALYISIDIAKMIQSYFIHSDILMYDEETDKPVVCQSWKLCDDLGQVEYIFSDKTGTLTSNQMELRRVSINGVLYGNLYIKPSETSIRMEDENNMRKTMTKLFDTLYVSDNIPFIDTNLHVHILDGGLQAIRIREFFTLLAVCHTVFAEIPDPLFGHKIVYKAQSPDEAALVSAAKDCGFIFLSRIQNTVIVNVLGEIREYEILNVLEFNSNRKRMSVIMKRPEGEIVLMCKGADSVIFERLSADTDAILKETTSSHLAEFANDGLRTLCLSFRVVPLDEYVSWLQKYKKAQAALVNREDVVDAAADLIEQNMTLMGCTAIEDKLQEGVPESIAKLASAGIKIWGDKMETAINIGFSCNLLTKSMILIVIQSSSNHETEKQIVEALERFWKPDGSPALEGSYALVIEGESLKYALEPSNKRIMLELGCRCKAVICCRVSPLQKARVVQLVRKGLGAICLAIGDGSNDVSMIQEADVGIGISGKEGLQAVMAADYAIAQFRFLSRLLLVHGRWSYMRTAELVLNYFYKNTVWLFVLFWYQFDCAFSVSVITDFTYSLYYNTFFSVLPTMVLGIFDQDVNDYYSIHYPQLYFRGIQQMLYNSQRFWIFVADGLYQSLVCYYVVYLVYNDSIHDIRGYDIGKDAMGTIMANSIILTINIYAILSLSSWTKIAFVCFFLTISVWIIYCVAYSFNQESFTFGVYQTLYSNPSFYLTTIFCIILCLLPKITIKFIQQYFWPSDVDIVREIQKNQKCDKMDGKASQKTMSFDSQLAEGIKLEDSIQEEGSITSIKSEFRYTSRARSEERLKDDKRGKKARRSRSAGSKLRGIESSDEEGRMNDGFGKAIKFTEEVKSSQESFRPSETKDSNNLNSSAGSQGIPTIAVSEAEKLKQSHTRKSSVSSLLKENFQKATRFVRKMTKKSGTSLSRRSSSIVYMNNQTALLSNTGFAFSQDIGVTKVISQTQPQFPSTVEAEPAFEDVIVEGNVDIPLPEEASYIELAQFIPQTNSPTAERRVDRDNTTNTTIQLRDPPLGGSSRVGVEQESSMNRGDESEDTNRGGTDFLNSSSHSSGLKVILEKEEQS